MGNPAHRQHVPCLAKRVDSHIETIGHEEHPRIGRADGLFGAFGLYEEISWNGLCKMGFGSLNPSYGDN